MAVGLSLVNEQVAICKLCFYFLDQSLHKLLCLLGLKMPALVGHLFGQTQFVDDGLGAVAPVHVQIQDANFPSGIFR